MIKHILFFLSLVSLSLYAQDGGGIQLEIVVPETVVAGTSFDVTIKLSKGELKDYSRFSQDLSAGFTASNISSPNADFTFDNERIRIIWLRLPSEQEIEVKYTIHVHQRLSGTLELGGTFAYVENGGRKFIDIENKREVTVMPSPDIDQSLVVDISDFKSVIGSDLPSGQSDFASVVRQEPVVPSNGIVLVTLLVHKPEGTKYLKLEETIPGGYSFEAIQTNRAIVSQAASIAKFIWMKPPAESIFILKYRLVPILEREQQPLLIQGTITYTEGDKNLVEEIEELSVSLEGLSSSQQKELLKTGIVADARLETTSAKTRVAPVETRSSSVLSVATLDKQDGIYFRVQVGAVRNPNFASEYFGEYDLLNDVKVEQIEAWYKYTVGSLENYNKAVQLLKQIHIQTPVKKAFVVAYKDGKRISVKQAMEAY